MQKVAPAPSKKQNAQDSNFIRRKRIQWPIEAVPYVNGRSPKVARSHVSTNGKADNSYDPYPYGWRYTQTITDDGQVESGRVALTLYELLHPQLGDVVMHKPPHEDNYTLLKTTLTTQFKNHPGAFVSSDLRIDLDLPGVEPLVPDISVIFDVNEEKAWGTFDTKKEGTVPSVAFEITSPSTRGHDFVEKREYYAQAGIPFYIIVDILYEDKNDPTTVVSGYELYAYELIDGNYVPIQPNDQGRCWIPSLELSVGVNEEGVLCYDAQGKLLLNHEQLNQALAESEQYAKVETARAAKQERIAQEQERIAQQEAARATEQERIAQEQERIAQQEAARAAEQERIAQQEAARAAEQERIAQEQERIAQQETARAAEQERIAQQESERAAEQERIAQQETTRAAAQERIAQEQERIAQQEAARATEAEAEITRLRALLAQLGSEA